MTEFEQFDGKSWRRPDRACTGQNLFKPEEYRDTQGLRQPNWVHAKS